jgi:hypothetical protein
VRIPKSSIAVLLATAVLLGWLTIPSNAQEKRPQPGLKSEPALTPTQLAERALHRRAVEAVIWGMPAVNFDLMYQAMIRDTKAGAGSNKIVYWSRLSDWKNQTLTPNPDAVYFMPFFNTKDVGPVVLEIPPADEGGSITGSVMDCWQAALEDVGPAGVDKGKGAKCLILPPGYKGKVLDGYIAMPSDNFQGYALVRSILQTGGDAGVAKAVAYGRRVKLYPLSQTANPPTTTFIDASDVVFEANIPYDSRFFDSLNRMVQSEPWLPRDKAMIDMLKSVGIEKGKPFCPDEATRAILDDAAQEAHAWLDLKYQTMFTPYYDGRQWALPMSPELIKGLQTQFSNPASYPVEGRGVVYSMAFFSPKRSGAASFYLMAIKDKQGRPFDGGSNYRLTVPANAPVTQYWSSTAYDRATHGLIREMKWSSRSSQTPGIQKNTDESVDVYFGPKAPAGRESNWVPTKPGRQFEVLFRFYGPEKPLFDKTWKLPDIEKAEGTLAGEPAKSSAAGPPTTVDTRIGKLEFTHEFTNGYPTHATVEKLYDQRDFQRACQAYLWAIPAVSFAEWQHGQASFGAKSGDIAALLSYDDRLGVLTPNATTPYYLAFADLAAGPMVIDMPPNVRGAQSDAWQRPLPDTNKSAKYLVLGPGQNAPADVAGFEVRRSKTFNIFVGVRITVTDPKEAATLLAQLRVYPYAQRANPPAAKVVGPQGKRWSGMPPRGMEYWRRLNEVIQREPVEEHDRFFHAMLRPLGFEKGKPFYPDARQTKILNDAALLGEAMARANTFERRFAGMMYRPDGRWHYALQLDADNSDAFWYLLDERAAWFYEAVGASPDMAPKRPGPSSAYLGAYTDKFGDWLDGARSYRLHVPPAAPAKLFWSVTLYDVDTRSLLRNEQKIADRSSRMDLKKNADGSVDIYCGPTAPAGFEANWIPTASGRSWFAYFRLYEPTEHYFDKSWPLGDFERIK